MVMIIITNDLNGKIAFMSSNTFGKVTLCSFFYMYINLSVIYIYYASVVWIEPFENDQAFQKGEEDDTNEEEDADRGAEEEEEEEE